MDSGHYLSAYENEGVTTLTQDLTQSNQGAKIHTEK